MKKIISMILTVITLFTISGASGCTVKIEEQEKEMTKTEREYYGFLNNLSEFPVNFVYGGVYYKGFSKGFTLLSRDEKEEGNAKQTTIVLSLDDTLNVKIVSNLFVDYNAYDYAVYFENKTSDKNSKVLEKVNAADMTFKGGKAHLKGIYGDYDYQYKPYDYDLSEQSVNFLSTRGRATHTYFPYFNIQTENGGAMLAIGWAGTWQADFKYDESTQSTHFAGTGTVDMKTYIKPGETVRTPLIAVMRYYEVDESKNTNDWRRFMIDCNMPKESAGTDTPVQPHSTIYFAFDTENPNKYQTDGSTAEDHTSWKNSYDSFSSHGLSADIHWFDAGWYISPSKQTVPFDWWGTVGTWELDPYKWPGESFNEYVDYAHNLGERFLVWFEPERVTHIEDLAKNYGYNTQWALAVHGKNNSYINNLGNKDCLDWTSKRIIAFMDRYNIDIYREDFNIDPGPYWLVGDVYEGENRNGITENLYIQGHYELWDRILEYCAETGKATYLDGCASGGGRQDLESMRRSVTFNRSDSDRFLVTTRLCMTNTLTNWIPYSSSVAKDSATLTENNCDIYIMRASYLCIFNPQANYYLERDTLDWDMYRKAFGEYNDIKKYLLKDFYPLSPYYGTSDDKHWSAYMYFDNVSDSGVVQAFRQANCPDGTYTVALKGVDANRYYSLRDLDGNLSVKKVKGSALLQGFTFRTKSPRTAIIIYIEPCAK